MSAASVSQTVNTTKQFDYGYYRRNFLNVNLLLEKITEQDYQIKQNMFQDFQITIRI